MEEEVAVVVEALEVGAVVAEVVVAAVDIFVVVAAVVVANSAVDVAAKVFIY